MYFNLAWRNIWRNKKRSLISTASVFFAVIIALGTRSMQIGSYELMIKNVVSFFTGYVQIHADGYWAKKSLDKSFIISDSLIQVAEESKCVTISAPRLESFVLVSGGAITDGAMLIGIDPDKEQDFTQLKDKLSEGVYLNPDDDGILLAEGLAKHLKLSIGDTAIVLGQGYHGVTAAGKFCVKGTVKYPTTELNNVMAYLSLKEAQRLYWAENRVTSLAIMIEKPKKLNTALLGLRDKFTDGYEVMSWEEMLPELVQAIETDNVGGVIMVFIIYLVIGFGILGTVLMMMLERSREFGMLIAIGMRRSKLRIILTIESVFLTFIGALAGTIAGFPILLYYYYHPIRLTGEWAQYMEEYGFEPLMPFSMDPTIFFWQGLTVLFIGLLAASYSLWKIGKLKPIDSLRTG